MDNNNQIWVSYNDYNALQEWKREMEYMALIKMAYFFWNNFSLDGFEDYISNSSDSLGK